MRYIISNFDPNANRKVGCFLMLSYFNPIQTENGLTLSVDRLVIDYYVGSPLKREAFSAFIFRLPLHYNVDTQLWDAFKPGTYNSNAIIKLNDGNSFYIGMGLNAAKTEWEKIRIEFNPNKVGCHSVLLRILRWLTGATQPMHRSIRRFDLAVDIPIDRNDVTLIKDRRLYTSRKHGAEFTEYLGAKASTTGRVKLYNKQTEAGLAYPLTRMEITLDPNIPHEKQPWPKVYYIDNHQCQLDDFRRLNDTQRFIVNALLAGFGSIKDLGRREQEKIKPVLEQYIEYVEISKNDYMKILQQLDRYVTAPYKLVRRDDIYDDTVPVHEPLPYYQSFSR